MANTISISVVADVAKLKSGLSSAQSDISKLSSASSKAAGFMKSSFKVMGAGVLAGGAALGAGFKFAYTEAMEARKVTAQTEAVIKSTGGAAGVTAKDIGALSEALSNKTAIDDELIQSGANLLLTFTNVRNEAGKGNDIFNQGVAIANDMSVAMGQSMKTSSIQLGKALNDPIAGIGSLSRVGVQFTAQQKEQIKTLVESGNVLGAQKVILGELETQFKGSAEAAATPMDKLRTVVANLAETVGLQMMPYIDKFATYLAANLPAALAAVESGFQKVLPALIEFGTFLRDTVFPVIVNVGEFMIEHAKTIMILAGVFYAVTAALAAYNGVMAAYHAIMNIVRVATIVWTNAQFALNLVMAANPLALVVIAIAALIAIIIIAWKNSETFRDIVIGAWNMIKDATSAVWGFIKNLLSTTWEFLKSTGSAVFNAIKTTITTIWNGIKEASSAVWGAIKNALDTVWGWIKTAVSTYFNFYKTIITTVWDVIKTVTSTVWNFIKGLVTGVWDTISSKVSSATSTIRNVIDAVWDFVKSSTQAAWDKFKSIITTTISTVLTAIGEIKSKIMGFLSGIGSWLYDAGKDLIMGFINGIKNMASSVLSSVTDVIDGAKNKAKSLLGIGSPSKVFRTYGKWTVQGLVKGLDENRNQALKASQRLAGAVSSGFEPRLAVDGLTGRYGASARANANVQVTVVAPVGSNPAEIGRELQGFLDDYYRSGGRVAVTS